MSSVNFISSINDSLKGVFVYEGVRIFGLAETVVKKYGDIEEYMPVILNSSEAEYVGLDDTVPLTVYHKVNSISISDKPGYGNADYFKNYSYSNVMIISYDSSKIMLSQDQLMLLIEANFPETIKVENYRKVSIKTESVITNTLSVFNTEYRSQSGLPLNFKMMAIYYRIDGLFDKNCFPKC